MNDILAIANLLTENPGVINVINFAELKHHLGAMINRLKEIEVAPKKAQHELSKPFIDIGTGTTDIYIGNLSVDQIKEEILEYLSEHDVSDLESLQAHLLETGQSGRINYTIVTLSDGSKWVIQPSNSTQWCHIHPAKPDRRSSTQTRLKNQILKTTLLAHAVGLVRGSDPLKLSNINYVRKNIGIAELEIPSKKMRVFSNLIKRKYFS